ncbi:hypothetical protein CYY_009259 [Polysphondylium violaceum]|uniref:Uridine-cytidine kinase n=1 Tax=Polysphondylium violaceum TaxID=133409 RepID=A0A8J4PNP9_9MYCE|nr:hypothetical protein CYY_009259 [Polysphondylium violaceum]
MISNEHFKHPFIIGVTGGTASGKTTVCSEIMKRLGNKRIAIICLDSFYKSLTPKDIEAAHDANYNFDHPDAFDWELLQCVLKDLKKGKCAEIPTYCFKSHSRLDETFTIGNADVILFEGILSFYTQALRDQMDIKIFVDTDSDTRLSRRVMRDIAERGRNLENVLCQYEKFVKPAFDDYILPTKKYADVIIPRGADNVVGIDLIVQHIGSKLNEREASRRLSASASQITNVQHPTTTINVHQ